MMDKVGLKMVVGWVGGGGGGGGWGEGGGCNST